MYVTNSKQTTTKNACTDFARRGEVAERGVVEDEASVPEGLGHVEGALALRPLGQHARLDLARGQHTLLILAGAGTQAAPVVVWGRHRQTRR